MNVRRRTFHLLLLGALAIFALGCGEKAEDPEGLVAELMRGLDRGESQHDWTLYLETQLKVEAMGAPCSPYLAQLLRSDNQQVRVEGVYYLNLIGSPAIPDILAVLKDGNSTTRGDAIAALELIGDPIAVDGLSAMLADADQSVRFKAAKALIKLGSPKGLAFLTSAMKDPDADVRGSAVQYLADVVDERMLLPLVEALGDPDPFVRSSAVEALGRLQDPRSVPYLKDVGLRDEAAAIRKRTAEVLIAITGQEWTYIDEYGREVIPR